ncbi:anti-sigma factor [Herbiconiux sp. P15]|uniref:anti-sigma factor family protein n=1 Tax=Herbiconiux liukaitaii TaxID=3342799 RepID=UPI0035B7234E
MDDVNGVQGGGDPYREWDAAYLAGILTPDERRRYERHLAECPPCAASVAEIAGLPGMLAQLTREEAEALLTDSSGTARGPGEGVPQAAEAGRVQDLARRAGRSRRRARRRLGGIVAAGGVLLAAVGVLFGVGVAQTGGPAPEAAPAATSAPSEGTVLAMAQVEPGWLDAELTVTEKGWGTRFDWNCSYRVDVGSYEPVDYDLVVTDAQGLETTVASWTATSEAAGNLSASTSIKAPDIRSVDIRVADTDRPLVRTTL